MAARHGLGPEHDLRYAADPRPIVAMRLSQIGHYYLTAPYRLSQASLNLALHGLSLAGAFGLCVVGARYLHAVLPRCSFCMRFSLLALKRLFSLQRGSACNDTPHTQNAHATTHTNRILIAGACNEEENFNLHSISAILFFGGYGTGYDGPLVAVWQACVWIPAVLPTCTTHAQPYRNHPTCTNHEQPHRHLQETSQKQWKA